MTLPVLLFPSCILNSLASLLVPEIAEYHALHQAKRIDGIINRVLYAALLFSLLVAGVFYAYAGELSNAVLSQQRYKAFSSASCCASACDVFGYGGGWDAQRA